VDPAISRALSEGAARLGVPLSPANAEQFSTYLALLLRWNERIKLTSVVRPGEVVEKHFLDSLAVAPALVGARTLVDVGSGAGFPGIPVAVVRPDLAVTVVESIQKKAAFLEAAKRELGLRNVEVFAGRMERLVEEARRFDAAVSRATFSPAEWLARGEALLAPGGRLIAMVVPDEAIDLAALAPGWSAQFESGRISEPYAPGRALVVLEGRRST
jgi:16S rRNA (guanine527-N7)-methyltransferase